MLYYQKQSPCRRFSFASIEEFSKQLKKPEKLVDIIAFCFMPNHFHLLLKQTQENGISDFIRKFTNSYTKYFNIKRKRTGPLFQNRFKAIRVETEEQLLHLSRYIHLNPFSGSVVETEQKLENYPYSSFPEYLHSGKRSICNKEIIFSYFKNPDSYRKFVLDNAIYQKNLQIVKQLILEEI